MVMCTKVLYSVFAFAIIFFGASGLFFLRGAEFLGLGLVIVYLGAVAVLFVFVTLLVGDPVSPRLSRAKGWLYPMTACGLGLFLGGLLQWGVWHAQIDPEHLNFAELYDQKIENIRVLGDVLYTVYGFPFQLVGLILVVAMIASVSLVFKKKTWEQEKSEHRHQVRKGVRLMSQPLGRGVEWTSE